MPTQPKQKLYCYVDETGQDTGGEFFLVSIVILEDSREELFRELESIEDASGRQKRKWTRSTPKQKVSYIRKVLRQPLLSGALYYSAHKETRAYVALSILSVAKAIHAHISNPYIATIVVDGLQQTEARRFARGLRDLRVHARTVKGADDKSEIFIRLADALAGFIRDTRTGDTQLKSLYTKALKNKIIHEI